MHHSPFFATALSRSFPEVLNTFELPGDHPGAFTLFVQWLYTGETDDQPDTLPGVACIAWDLGAKFQCPAFQDRVMCQLIDYHKTAFLKEDSMRLIYRISPPGSELRNFAVDQVCWDRTMENRENAQQVGAAGVMAAKDFNRDLLERLLEYGNEPEDPCEEGSVYLKVLDYAVCRVDSS